MPDLLMLREVISTGSDLALIAFAWAIWKIERRVFVLENKDA